MENSSSSESESMLPENTLEMERNLHASAIKNNLDDASVKKILKVCYKLTISILLLYVFNFYTNNEKDLN